MRAELKSWVRRTARGPGVSVCGGGGAGEGLRSVVKAAIVKCDDVRDWGESLALDGASTSF